MARLAIVREPIALEALIAELERERQRRDEGCGAVCSFLGLVRASHRGRRVRYLEYEAFEPMALKVLARIETEVAREWPGALLGLHHRIGRLAVGEASVAIAAATAHRGEAFAACHYAIERVKQILPIWKHEFFEDGDEWVEGALADPDDEAARLTAKNEAAPREH